ncbi:MAG: nitrogenase, partial [Lachnospiraceae bacterium]|nr:nitrogenase [Lachnospiraceae bacterium]
MEKTIDDEIRIADASFPKPFVNGLEFNAPVHGTWNIVHIGLAMPEAIQIYVCAKNCMRGVVLTAAEMNRPECFSYVILNEEDMIRENIDDVTIEGVKDVLTKRIKAGQKPRAVQLFTVCVHHFLGSNYEYIYRTLEEEFPDIDFYRCYMDPVMQKKGLT